MRKSILSKVDDYYLTHTPLDQIEEEHFVSRSTINGELKRRNLINVVSNKTEINYDFTITTEELETITLATLAREKNTTIHYIHSYIKQTYGLTPTQAVEMRIARYNDDTDVTKLSDDELKKPISYLIKKYGMQSPKIRVEREKRGMFIKTKQLKLLHLSDDEILNNKVEYICNKYNVSIDTVNRERKRRKQAIDPNFKTRKRNILKELHDEEIFGTTAKNVCEKYNVHIGTVFKERKRRRELNGI